RGARGSGRLHAVRQRRRAPLGPRPRGGLLASGPGDGRSAPLQEGRHILEDSRGGGMSVDRGLVLSKSADAAYRIYDGEATIVLPSMARVSVLNEMGSRVWEAIDGRRTIGEIVDEILEQFDVTRETAEADLFAFVDALREHGMVS